MTISNLWFAQCNAELRFRSDNSFPRDGLGQLFTTTNTHFCHFIEKKNIGWDVFTQWEWGWYFHILMSGKMTNFVKEQIFTPRHGTERGLNGNPKQEEITLVLLGVLLVYWSREHIKRECTHFSRNPGPCLEMLQPWQDLWKRFSHNLDWKLTRIENQPKSKKDHNSHCGCCLGWVNDRQCTRLGESVFGFSSFYIFFKSARCSCEMFTYNRAANAAVNKTRFTPHNLLCPCWIWIWIGLNRQFIEPNFSPSPLESEAKSDCVMGRPFFFSCMQLCSSWQKGFLGWKMSSSCFPSHGVQGADSAGIWMRRGPFKGHNISAGSSGPGGQDGGNRLSRPKRNSEGSNMKLDDDMIPECFQSTQSSMWPLQY